MRSFQLEPQLHYRKLLRYELAADTPQDLYEKNFSTVKSGYGTDLLGNGVFTGDSVVSTVGSPVTEYYTDSGEVLVGSGRYRCTSSRIKLVSIDTIGASLGTAPSDSSETWASAEAEDYLLRYAKSDIDATITIEIDSSLVTSIISETSLLVDPFPSWMALRTDQTSVGFKMMNVMAQEIEDFKFQAISFPQRSFINSIPTGIKYRGYLSLLSSTAAPIDVVGDGVELSPAEDLTEFIEAEESEHVYYQEGLYLFTTQGYTTFTIDNALYAQEPVHIANAFDHIGMSISLIRLPDENNEEYKIRLIDVFANPPGASWDRIQHTIERESGVEIEHIWELNDSRVPWGTDNDPSVSHIFYADPTNEHRELARWCNENARIGFDYMRWGQMLWDLYPHPYDLAEIPYLLDQAPLSGSARPGIGYGSDLQASKYEHTGSFPYMVEVNVVGKTRSQQSVYPPVVVSGTIIPTARQTKYENEYSGYVAIKLVSDGLDYYINADMAVARDELNQLNTNSWRYILPQFSTEQNLTCALSTDTEATPVNIRQGDITLYGVYDGYWDFATGSLVANTPENKLYLGFAADDISKGSKTWTVAIEGGHPSIIYADCHDMVGSTVLIDWVGQPVPYQVTCNPNMAIANGSMPIPQFYETADNLGTITYTLAPVDSVSPEDATYTLAFSSGGSTIVGWPDPSVTINLSSSFQITTQDKLTDAEGTAQIFSGTLTPDNPVAVFDVDEADFSLPATFEQGRYVTTITGKVYVRLPQTLESSAQLVVELNPVYMFEWAPMTLPGTVYLSGNEYYQHADMQEETVSGGTTHTLSYPIAPGTIITTSTNLQEIHPSDDDGNPAITVTQEIVGNGTRYLPVWYKGLNTITIDSASKTEPWDGIVDFGSETDPEHTYVVTYKVNNSFVVDYNNIVNGEYLPLITFAASSNGVLVQYTPYSREGYWVDTEVPTNPLFTTKNRDFLYLDDETVTVDSVVILTKPYLFYAGKENIVCAQVLDADGNGISGASVTFTTDDAQSVLVTSDTDGYAYALLNGPVPPATTIAVTASVGNKDDEKIFDLMGFNASKPAGLYLLEQNFQVASIEQHVAQTIKLLLLDANGDPIQATGTYTVWCTDDGGIVGSTNISTNSSGIASLSYTPTRAGQYVATFTINSLIQYAGWCLVDRL